MLTIQNYFQKINTVDRNSLPDNLKEAVELVQEFTENHTTWKHYHADKQYKQKIDKYLASLNSFLEKGTTVTLEQALSCAKDLIRAYVHRGDSLKDINSSMLGSHTSEYSASVKSMKIIVDRVNTTKVHFAFSLSKIFNELLAEKKPAKPSSKPATTTKAAQKPTKPVQAANNKKPIRIDYKEGHPVERIEEEVKFIKRYVMLHNRTKTKAQVLNFINALQRAITEKRIRKTSRYAEPIRQIQNQLVKAYQVMGNTQTFTIDKHTLKSFSTIAGSEKIRFSTNYLKRFIGIQGKNITKEKAQRLYEMMLNAMKKQKITKGDPYYDRIIAVSGSLKKFIQEAKKGDTVALHRATLNGLDGVLGCACEDKPKKKKRTRGLDGVPVIPLKHEPSGVMSVDQVRTMEYKPVNITGRWLELIGRFCLPTQFFVHGIGGSGKTSFVLLLTQYLASLGYRILYVAGEQYNTPTFTELMNRLNIVAGDNFKIVGSINTLNPADFDFVVLDSKDHLEINVDQFITLMKQYPGQSFIVLSQAVKSGNFTGRERWRNTVDVMVQADQGIVRTGHDKNRWGGAGEMKIFELPKPTYYPIAA